MYSAPVILRYGRLIIPPHSLTGVVECSLQEGLQSVIIHCSVWLWEPLFIFFDDVFDVYANFSPKVEHKRSWIIEIVSHLWELRKPRHLNLALPAPILKMPRLFRVGKPVLVRQKKKRFLVLCNQTGVKGYELAII